MNDITYHPDKNGVLIREHGVPIAYAKARSRTNGDPAFLVTATEHDGRVWYSYGLADRTRERLGIPDSYTAQREYAERINREQRP